MIRLIYRLFKKEFNQLAYLDQIKVDKRQGLRFGFVMDGVNYYVYGNIFDMPMLRLHKIQMLVNQLRMVVNDEEMQKFIDNMKDALDKATSGGQVKQIARIGFLIEQLDFRKKNLIHPDLMLQISAACCIAEDEDPTEWNDENEARKLERIKRHYSEGALFPFFRSVGLTQFLPNLNTIEADFQRFWEESTSQIAAMNQILNESN